MTTDSDEKYRRMVELANDAIFAVDADSALVVDANAKAEEMTGRSRSEMIGKPVWELHPPAEQEHARELFRGVCESGSGLTSDLSFERSDGTVVPLDISAGLIEIDGARIIQRICRDVTQHRRQQRELEQSEERLRRRVEFEEMVMSISARFISLAASEVDAALDDALARIGEFSGTDRAYIYIVDGRGTSDMQVWVRSRRQVFRRSSVSLHGYEWLMDALAQGEHVTYSTDTEPADWQADSAERVERKRHSLVVPMLTLGSLLGFVGFDVLQDDVEWDEDLIKLLRMLAFVFANALERKISQQELEAAHRQLERKVEQRTRELQQKHSQLLHSEKMALLGQLVAGVAHEINTPLGALRSNTDTLARAIARLGEHVQRCGDAASAAQSSKLIDVALQVNSVSAEAVKRVTKIVSSLRQFARLDQADVDHVDIHEGLESTLELVQHEGKHRISLEKSYSALPIVQCYPNRLNQVFMNLLVNAQQAIAERGTIRIVTRRATPAEAARLEPCPDGCVVIEIADTGVGIPLDNRQRIFDPGFTTKGVGVGTGLGLSIVSQIIAEHGGHIDVESEPGRGTTFRIVLPVSLPRSVLTDSVAPKPPAAR